MARVPILEKEQVSDELRATFEKMEAHGGRVLNIFKVMAHCPKIGRDFLRLGHAVLTKGRLDGRLRELAILRVGHLAKAHYEWTQHAAIAQLLGVPEAQIQAVPVWQTSDQFNDNERAVLQYTDEVAERIRVSDDTFQKVKSFLSDEEIVELTTAVGYYGMVSRILEALQVELEKQ